MPGIDTPTQRMRPRDHETPGPVAGSVTRPCGRSLAAAAVFSVLLLGWLSLAPPVGAEELDRLIAAVNGRVLTLSDLELARQLNALVLFGREAGDSGVAEQVERLIDLELLRGELEIFAMDADSEALEARLRELRNGYAEIGGLPALLPRIGLREEELREYLRLQVALQRFVQLRFRPFAEPAADQVGEYYRERLVPDLRRRGVEVPSLEDVFPKIEAILREEEANAALDKWLSDMRAQARIERFDPVRRGFEGDRIP